MGQARDILSKDKLHKKKGAVQMVKRILSLALFALLSILLSGCFANIEVNIKDSKIFQTTPDYPHVFTLSQVEMEVEFEDYSTRIRNPKTGDPFLYMTDSNNFYLISGNRENLRKVLASDNRIQFGFFSDEPRYAEVETIDFIILPIDRMIEATDAETIILEFIDVPNRRQLAEYTIDFSNR